MPEVIKNQPQSLTREEQLARLQYWTTFIASLSMSRGLSWRERWEEIDKKFVEQCNIAIGWKDRNG